MGINYALACGDCLEFIDLHKFSLLEYQSLSLQKVTHLSNRLIAPVTAQQLLNGLESFIPSQQYIEALLPFIRNFIASHQDHFLFLTCDIGEHPWNFGEPQCFEWREIQAVFNYDSQFLPKNLVKDFAFSHWQEVLAYYSEHESWFLDQQLRDERDALRQAFEQEVLTT